MDEVWLVSICLTFLAFVIVLLSLRKTNNETENAVKAKERSPAPVFASAQPAARFMEMTLEDIEKSMERLGAVMGAETEKQPQPDQQSAPASQARAVEVKALPVPKAELINEHFATEDWEFEDDEEIGALQCEGAEKQYYHLYWDEESLPDRSSYSVREKADLTRRKKTYNLDTRERDMTCSNILQSSSNPLYLQYSGKQFIRCQRSGQVDKEILRTCTIHQSDSTAQPTTELSKSLQPASGHNVNEISTQLNLRLCMDRPIYLESGDTDDCGKLCGEEFSLLNYKLQTSHGDSESESSSMDSFFPPSPRLRKWSPIPLSLGHYMEREDSSSIDDNSSSPTNSKDSRFTSHEESSSSDISLLSFVSDSSLSESDIRDHKNSTLITRLRTGLVKTVTKNDKTPLPDLVPDSSITNLNASKDVAVCDMQIYFTETERKGDLFGGQKSDSHPCSVSSEESLTSLCIVQPTTFYSGEPNTTSMILNVENAGRQISSECSREPVNRRSEKQYRRKHVKDDTSAIDTFLYCKDAENQHEGALCETSPSQDIWPDYNQVKIEPSEQAAPRRHGAGEGLEIMEHPPATSSTRNIMEQIEQAVQETPEHAKERSEYVRVRRAPAAPRLETPPRDEIPHSRSFE
ncbi:uncharacterized protein LOC129706884 isoform X2 [Leucoraja erinacea]|uniref:uncharacterized protein LOC129706884 isoform X2 n=1 Tax=Leucoraja erinaceus TaxID=7782 RepID=UPI002456919C|nr:uncharacterized protein LOC129706884 isoform X2 [Leucoraja erinacea]